eukprot:1024027-Amphidinium_carterae.1
MEGASTALRTRRLVARPGEEVMRQYESLVLRKAPLQLRRCNPSLKLGANPNKKVRVDPALNQKAQLVPYMRALNLEIDQLLSGLTPENKAIVRTTAPEKLETGSALQTASLRFCALVT